MKILVIGPSPEKSKGGMATVIKGIRDDKELNEKYDIDIFDSYVDGSKVKRALYTFAAFERMKAVYKPYDLFHIHMASYGSTFRKANYIRFLKDHGKKVILHIHGAAYMDFYNQLNDKRKRYVVDTLNRCDLVIALSDEWKERFEKHLGLTNCVALPNGIDMEAFEGAVTEDDKNAESFLMLGRLGQRKGTYDLIEAVGIARDDVPGIRCYLAGDGEVEKTREVVRKKGLEENITVVGWADFNKKVNLLKSVCAVVLPSYNEGLPMAILEGMACGKGIISTTVGAIPEVISPENGILTEPGDVEALSKAFVRYAQDREYRTRSGKENMNKVSCRFSMRAMHRKLADYYEAVFKG